jgi:hypothetical protein
MEHEFRWSTLFNISAMIHSFQSNESQPQSLPENSLGSGEITKLHGLDVRLRECRTLVREVIVVVDESKIQIRNPARYPSRCL